MKTTAEHASIRHARPEDARELAELAERTFRSAFGEANTREDMDSHCERSFGESIQTQEILDPMMETWLSCHDEQMIGFVQLCWRSPPPAVVAKSPVEILRFYVDASWHGRGVAQQLMEISTTRAVKRGADKIWLGVWERNPRAIAFYRKCGFEPVGEHVFKLGSDPQRDVVMVRPV